MKNVTKLWCLHGNLQRPAVWECFNDHIPYPMETLDLFADPATGFDSWTQRFCNDVAQSTTCKQYLMGYSLGGRLALHAYLAMPERWHGVIIIGADPGLTTDEARARQLTHDQGWGKRFLTEPWGDLMNDWDTQDVFCNHPNPKEPREADFDRSRVSLMFDRYSKGRQKNLKPLLADCSGPPLLFISGGADAHYTTIGRSLATSCPAIRHVVLPDVGHRVPWEAPDAFIRTVTEFIDVTKP